MGFLVDIFEIFLWVIFAVWLLRRIANWLSRKRSVRPPNVQRQPPAPMKTLHRDPWCGTYVAEDIALRLDEEGKTLHFCSQECRSRYIARQRRSAHA